MVVPWWCPSFFFGAGGPPWWYFLGGVPFVVLVVFLGSVWPWLCWWSSLVASFPGGIPLVVLEGAGGRSWWYFLAGVLLVVLLRELVVLFDGVLV